MIMAVLEAKWQPVWHDQSRGWMDLGVYVCIYIYICVCFGKCTMHMVHAQIVTGNGTVL